MEKPTIEDLKSSPGTLIQFFILQEKAEMEMFNDAYKFYIAFSKHKKRKKNSKKFYKHFIRAMKYYNSAV